MYALKLFIAFKMAHFCFGENLDFPDVLQKKFYNINYRISNSVIQPLEYNLPCPLWDEELYNDRALLKAKK